MKVATFSEGSFGLDSNFFLPLGGAVFVLAGNIFTPLRQSFYSSRGGGVVIALASRSMFAQRGLVLKLTSQLVGLWLAGVRIPSPALFYNSSSNIPHLFKIN